MAQQAVESLLEAQKREAKDKEEKERQYCSRIKKQKCFANKEELLHFLEEAGFIEYYFDIGLVGISVSLQIPARIEEVVKTARYLRANYELSDDKTKRKEDNYKFLDIIPAEQKTILYWQLTFMYGCREFIAWRSPATRIWYAFEFS